MKEGSLVVVLIRFLSVSLTVEILFAHDPTSLVSVEVLESVRTVHY